MRLDQCSLKITVKKCQWFDKDVQFLGFLVSGEGIRSNPEKVKAVKNWKPPFIDSLSSKAKPLYALLKKDVHYVWFKEAQQAFDLVKKDLLALPTLAHPNPHLPYDFHCDASNIALVPTWCSKVYQLRMLVKLSIMPNATTHKGEGMSRGCLVSQAVYPYLYGKQHQGYKTGYVSSLTEGRSYDQVHFAKKRSKTVCLAQRFGVFPFIPVGLSEQVLFHVHSKETGGHFGIDKTLGKAKGVVWLQNMCEDVELWVKSCEGCQRFMVRSDNKRPPMKPITPKHVGEVWATDIALFSESLNGERYLLVLMEYLTKWVTTAQNLFGIKQGLWNQRFIVSEQTSTTDSGGLS
ncbi:hypothetical protein G6F56_007092 [Rhizopus delemar]|nr:hypothetical protein G6F56_007092 [Rhizopus delemar]